MFCFNQTYENIQIKTQDMRLGNKDKVRHRYEGDHGGSELIKSMDRTLGHLTRE